MSEAEAVSPESTSHGNGALATGLALDAARNDPALRDDLAAFLKDQRAMLHLQMEEMQAEEPYKLSHHRLRRFSGWAKAIFEFSVGVIALAMVLGLGVMVWHAAHSNSNVIESFAVPPELADRGLTGEVVAARLLDRLQVVQTPSSSSVSAAQAVSTSSSDNVKVEIPETGISLGELYRFLRRWLGHETYVSGEVVRHETDLAVSVRVNGAHGATFQGPEADLDALLQKAAEHVFATVQPVRYGTFLQSQTPQRNDEALAIYQRLVADTASTPFERAGALNGLALSFARMGEMRQALPLLQQAQKADPTTALPFTNAVIFEMQMGHSEAALAHLPQAQAVFEKNHDFYSAAAVTSSRSDLHAQDAELRGDYARAVTERESAAEVLGSERRYFELLNLATDRAQLHDGGVVAWLAEQPRPAAMVFNRMAQLARPFQIQAALRHWQRVIAISAEAEQAYEQLPRKSVTGREYFITVFLHPWLALARAKTGDIAAAERLIAPTPADCYDCVRIRGMIASEAKQWSRADGWFAKAVQDAPSIPFAYEDWGRSLLDRGQTDAAIGKFKQSSEKGPQFADALEGWGEALIAKSQSHLALAKFTEAEKYAPEWGRLHLKWGEALAFSGNKAEAAKHFARAATLDLTPAEKSELARMGANT